MPAATDPPDSAQARAGAVFHVRVEGHLDDRWAKLLGAARLVREAGGTTVIVFRVADPPALYGLLARLRDLGMSLASVVPVESDRKVGKGD
jgi:hypothetical protein